MSDICKKNKSCGLINRRSADPLTWALQFFSEKYVSRFLLSDEHAVNVPQNRANRMI